MGPDGDRERMAWPALSIRGSSGKAESDPKVLQKGAHFQEEAWSCRISGALLGSVGESCDEKHLGTPLPRLPHKEFDSHHLSHNPTQLYVCVYNLHIFLYFAFNTHHTAWEHSISLKLEWFESRVRTYVSNAVWYFGCYSVLTLFNIFSFVLWKKVGKICVFSCVGRVLQYLGTTVPTLWVLC